MVVSLNARVEIYINIVVLCRKMRRQNECGFHYNRFITSTSLGHQYKTLQCGKGSLWGSTKLRMSQGTLIKIKRHDQFYFLCLRDRKPELHFTCIMFSQFLVQTASRDREVKPTFLMPPSLMVHHLHWLHEVTREHRLCIHFHTYLSHTHTQTRTRARTHTASPLTSSVTFSKSCYHVFSIVYAIPCCNGRK